MDPYQIKKRSCTRITNIPLRAGTEYMVLALIPRMLAEFLHPIAMQQYLLNCVESGGEGTTASLWVWVSSLLLGPLVASMVPVAHLHLHLVEDDGGRDGDHQSARARVEAEKSEATAIAGDSTAVAIPNNPSIAELDNEEDSMPEEGSDESASSAKGMQEPRTRSADAAGTETEPRAGKFTNHITMDR